jgi:hypothetical protein
MYDSPAVRTLGPSLSNGELIIDERMKKRLTDATSNSWSALILTLQEQHFIVPDLIHFRPPPPLRQVLSDGKNSWNI